MDANFSLFDNTTCLPDPSIMPKKTQEVAEFVFGIVFGSFTMFENLIIILSPVRVPSLRTPSNSFIVSIAVADLLVGSIHIWNNSSIFGYDSSCNLSKVSATIFFVCFLSSLIHLLLLAVDRFLAITRPYDYETMMRKRNVGIIISVAWFVALILGSLPAMGWNLGWSTYRRSPYFGCALDFLFPPAYWGILFTISLGIFLAIIIQYSVILRIAHDHESRAVSQEIKGKIRKVRKSVVAFLLVVGVFFVSWSPMILYMIMSAANPMPSANVLIARTIGWFLAQLNSALNPLVYWWRIKAFRSAMRRVFCCPSQPNMVVPIE
ncbi:cannabinoid receptor 1-like [Glandiceps talaboti]